MQKYIHLCYVDFSKAFDRVKHEEMTETLGETGKDGKVKNYYDFTLEPDCHGANWT